MEEKNISGSHEHHGHEHHNHEHHAHETSKNKFGQYLNSCKDFCKKFKHISLKTTIIIACVIVVATLLFVYKDLFIVATVNGSPISRYSVIHELESRSGAAALENIILEKLVNMEARKQGIEVSEADVDSEVALIESQISSQGGTLEQALAMQGMTIDVLRGQIMLQKKMEGLLGERVAVSESEIDSFIESNGIEIQAGEEEQIRSEVSNQLKQEKVSAEAGSYLESLKSESSIKYFISY